MQRQYNLGRTPCTIPICIYTYKLYMRVYKVYIYVYIHTYILMGPEGYDFFFNESTRPPILLNREGENCTKGILQKHKQDYESTTLTKRLITTPTRQRGFSHLQGSTFLLPLLSWIAGLMPATSCAGKSSGSFHPRSPRPLAKLTCVVSFLVLLWYSRWPPTTHVP